MKKEKEEAILRAFEELSWEPVKDKVEIELDSKVNRFSTLLFSMKNWKQTYSLLKKSADNGRAIFISNYFRSLNDIRRMIAYLMRSDYVYTLDFASKYYEQFKGYSEQEAENINNVLMNLLQEGILERSPEYLEFCESCEKLQIVGMGEEDDKCDCGSRIFRIFRCSLNKNVKKSILTNQFLEIFVKNCLNSTGLKLVSKEIDGKKVSTSIQYFVPTSPVEIDVAAVYGNWTFICECKTNRVRPKDVEKKFGQLQRLISSIRSEGVELKVIYLLVTTEEIDKYVQPHAYIGSYDWLEDLVLIQGEDVYRLEEKLKDRVSMLPH